ncbi:autotransporter outer membrane beta-barrel domain-containing protein [Fusobacterium nucleatum]|uniref:Autotransporter subunit beta n=2 Tax=Fusobacterium TaxID=848 RepID=A0A0S2ZKB3_9FUSO|nr:MULTISPECIES: autotransporter outer membrane beta-barrel domain-containing protein [Fusobacterium]ALQ39379.1 autotransporter subunit beta [Fusobacterium hwasookii ChDC F174]PHH96276.1 autotransporter outer membrane beta-barrel domain-containing protein [Fusobacterium polymorphum]
MNYKKLMMFTMFLLSLSSYGEIRIKENEVYKDSLKNQNSIRLVGNPVHTGYGVKTGIIFDFMKKSEDTKTQPDIIRNKNISLKDAKFALIGDISNYPNSHRVGIIENSKITFEKGKDYNIKDIPSSEFGNKMEIKFGKVILKNSQIIDEDKATNIEINNNPNGPEYGGELFAQKNPKNLTGFIIERDFPAPLGVYDIKINGDIKLDITTVNPSNQRGHNLYYGEGATPVLKFGKNTRSKFRTLQAFAMPGFDAKGMVYGDVRDTHVIFDEGSEVEMEDLDVAGTNVIFNGGKVKIHSSVNYLNIETRILENTAGIIKGKAVFDLKGGSIENSESANFLTASDRSEALSHHLIDLEMLPESKVDIGMILNGNDYDSENPSKIFTTNLKPEEDRAPFRLQFDNNTKLYLKYVNESDLTMKQGSHLYMYREGEENEKLSSTNKGNPVEMRGKLKLENANLHFRVNMKDKLSDKMVVKHNTISGTGGTIYVKNSGSTDTTGREKVVLIEAKKGVDSGVKFRLANNVEIGAYEYVLDNSLVGSGREYYLIGEKAHIIPDVPSNVKNDVPALSKPSMKTQKGVSGNSINLQNSNLEILPINSKNYTAELTQGNINLTNSTLWVEQGRGLKLKNTPINIKNSSMVINTKDTNSGVKIDAETSTGAILKVERTSANANANHRDLFVNGTFKVIGNKTTPNAITLGKNTVTQIYNPKGDTALDLRNTSMKIEDGAKLYLEGKRALNSKNSNISGKGIFHIKGDMIHEGDNGVNLTFEKGSFVESSSIQFDESNVGSSLRFKSGSELRISNLSNAKMTFDKGSRVFLYTSNQEAEEIKNGDANKSIDQVINGITLGNNANTVTLTGVVEMNDVDIYTRVNLKDNLGDHIVIDGDKGLLKGTGATLHLRNTGSLEVDNISRSVRFFTGKLADGFVWKVAHPLEVGAYVYDTTLSQTKDDKGITRVTFNLKEQRRRQAKLTSTAKGFMENTYADYFQELGTVDDVFKGMSNIEFTKKDSVWAKVGGTTLETKEGFKSNAKSVYVGFDRQVGQIENLHAGIFLGNTSASKKYDIYSGDGKSQIFHGGAYLSYRSMLGDGDFILKYSKGKTEYGVLDTVGDKISNKYDYSSKMAAFRFGRKFYPFSKENLYIEPAIQVSYGEIDNVNSTASNGLNTKIKTIRTWTTGGDVKLGFKTNALNTYVKAGVSKEFLGDTDFLFNTSGDERRQVDKGIATFGAGLEYHIGDHSISLEVVRKESNLLKDFYQASIGYQYKF